MFANNFNICPLSAAIFLHILVVLDFKNLEGVIHSNGSSSSSEVEVSAVFISCNIDENSEYQVSSLKRFQRDELLKYDALHDCVKKIGVTVKLTADSDDTGEEYFPIEHVYDGPSSKRVRLLDPYVLRIHREPPLQAYKLLHVDTVNAIVLSNEKDTLSTWSLDKEDALQYKGKLLRRHGNNDVSSNHNILTNTINGRSQSVLENNDSQDQRYAHPSTVSENIRDEGDSDGGAFLVNRDKRQEYNVVIENSANSMSNWRSIEPASQENNFENKTLPDDTLSYMKIGLDKPYINMNYGGDNKNDDTKLLFEQDNSIGKYSIDDKIKKDENSKYETNPYSLYEIGNPYLLHNLHLQFYEKSINPEGKTMWNDITAGEHANIGTTNPEWVRDDVSIRYRSSGTLNRSEYVLPSTGLSLLKRLSEFSINEPMEDYIVVPTEDILYTDSNKNNVYDMKSRDNISADHKRYRRVVVRVNRALSNGAVAVVMRGIDNYITVAHERPLEAQIDIEARADNNQLIRIGSSARISTVVTDSTRNTRSVLTVHATNTGLAAAHFRAAIRDCGHQLSTFLNHDRTEMATSVHELIPPHHTKRMDIEIPGELTSNSIHCTVALINKDDEAVAVRDVIFKKSDRCFCVWHCNCVCLDVDPKLMCKELSTAKLAAAGISVNDRPRRERSICYPDRTTINIFFSVFGVLFFLVFLGCLKACVGICLRSVGMWNLDRMVKLPRQIEHYYEPWLCMRKVIYDGEGWPLHPDSKQRTVRVLSLPMEFVLNTIFFLLWPCLIIRCCLVKLCETCYQNKSQKQKGSKSKLASSKNTRKYEKMNCPERKGSKTKELYLPSSSAQQYHDYKKQINDYYKKLYENQVNENQNKNVKAKQSPVKKSSNKKHEKKNAKHENLEQSHDKKNVHSPSLGRRRQHKLNQWMTPHAEDLSEQLWNKQGQASGGTNKQKLCCEPCSDDDSDYDLTEKSRESLAKNEKDLCGSKEATNKQNTTTKKKRKK